MNKRMVLYNLGRILMVSSLLMVLCAGVSLLCRDGCLVAFLVPGLLMFLLGFLATCLRPQKKTLYAREGFVTVGLLWILLSALGALPFLISGAIPSFTDAFFETVSGFTTTGSSILTEVESLPKSLLFWRSLTHWIGGMGVLALAIAILPRERGREAADAGNVYILKAESPGPTFGKLVSKLQNSVQILYLIYTAMTLLEIVLLLLGGMPLFDSLLNAFGTAGTGGFAIKNASIAAYDSAYVDTVIGIFMVLFGINFNVYYFLLTGQLLKALKSEEVRWYLGLIVGVTTAITLNILPRYESVGKALRYAFFQVSSLITTTGFVTADYELWPTFSKILLILLMCIGACAGSTGGGFKVSRAIILIKSGLREVRRQIHPRRVSVIRCDDAPVPERVVSGVGSYFVIYILLLALSTLVLSFDGEDTTTTFTAVIACLNNIGPGLGKVGATGNFAAFSPLSKYILSFDMLAGRLELYPLLIALAPRTWKH